MTMKKQTLLISTLLLIGMTGSHVVLADNVTKDSANDKKIQLSTEATESKEVASTESSTSTEATTNTSEDNKGTTTSEVEKTVEKLVGEKKGEEVPVDDKPAASKIREELSSGGYGISKEELDKYTDEQLEQTMTLFTRYNYDITGMDYGAYSRLLTTLFVDKTVNLNDALTQLYFNPSGFNSYSEMIPRVDELQTYLKTLYPVNSTFIPGVNLTNDQLIAKLNNLQKLEEEARAKGEELPFGRIAGLLQSSDGNGGEGESSSSQTTEPSVTSSTEKGKVTTPTTSDDKGGFLPKTGEEKQKNVLTLLGAFTILGMGFVLRKKM